MPQRWISSPSHSTQSLKIWGFSREPGLGSAISLERKPMRDWGWQSLPKMIPLPSSNQTLQSLISSPFTKFEYLSHPLALLSNKLLETSSSVPKELFEKNKQKIINKRNIFFIPNPLKFKRDCKTSPDPVQ